MRRALAVAATGGLLAALAVAGPSAASAATPAAAAASGAASQSAAAAAVMKGVAWGDCTDPTLVDAGAQCGYVSVPLDYGKPDGKKIKIAVSIVRHTVPDSQYQGVMLVNPGGPGGSGQYLSILGEFVPNNAGASYDWIGFDPRGVGASIPSLSCKPYYFAGPRPDYIPVNVDLEKTWLARSKSYANACGKDGGALLDHMTTVDSAKDMDRIRAALGAKQINYYGFSYGTYLGSVYGTLFPNKVRRMVLDSNVDPRKVWYQANLDQDVAFERNVKIWFGWVAKYDSVYHLGKTEAAVERLWYKVQNQLRAKPAGGKVGPDEWTDIFLYAGYYQSTWLDLGSLFASWVHDHDVKALLAEYRSTEGLGDDNGFAVYNAVQCTDTQWPTSWATWKKDNWRVFQKAPFETWGNAWFNAPCLYWQGKASTPVTVNGSKVSSALLIDETLDAATPYPGSLEVRKLFPNSSLIALPGGTSHANSLFGDACLDNQIAAYLADGTLPPRKAGNRADTTCAPLPVPDPTQAAAVSAVSATSASAATASAVSAGSLSSSTPAADRVRSVLMAAFRS